MTVLVIVPVMTAMRLGRGTGVRRAPVAVMGMGAETEPPDLELKERHDAEDSERNAHVACRIPDMPPPSLGTLGGKPSSSACLPGREGSEL